VKRNGDWLRRGLALAAGAAAALAHPPFGFLPGLLGFGVLMHLIDRSAGDRPLRSAFLTGWLAGLAYFGIGVWWVAEAFLVDVARHGWMAPFAVVLLGGGLALFWGAGAALYRRSRSRGLSRVLVFAACLTATEWLRGHVLTGFPWNLPGETFAAGSALSQGAALMGAYGLTWLVLAIAASLTLAREGRRGVAAAGAALLVLAGLWGYGALRLDGAAIVSGDALTVRIVQANIPQAAKYDAAMFEKIVTRYTTLTRAPGPVADLVIWPEGAIPAAFEDYLAPGAWTRDAISRSLEPGQTLLVGGFREEAGHYYNSLIGLRGPELGVVALYDKHRLVPFGEYLPLEPLWFGAKQLVGVGDGFSPGPPPAPVALGGGLPAIQPLICYESLFPGFTRRGAARSGVRPGLIVNVSNDAWFGRTSGPLQHLSLASYRAIEEGLPLLRATPTGVSAVVDAYGRTVSLQTLGLGEQGVIDARLPQALTSTLYTEWGDAVLIAFLLLSVGVWTLDARRRLEDTAKT
jgi:apolipoprotein N-acyltransferase